MVLYVAVAEEGLVIHLAFIGPHGIPLRQVVDAAVDATCAIGSLQGLVGHAHLRCIGSCPLRTCGMATSREAREVGGLHRGARHAQRLQDALGDEFVPGLPAHRLDQLRGGDEHQVAVSEFIAEGMR